MAPPAELDDRGLVEAAQADPARFLALYDRYFHRVYAYVLRRAGSRVEIVDVATAMGKSDGAIKQLQRRALETLRARMESSDG